MLVNVNRMCKLFIYFMVKRRYLFLFVKGIAVNTNKYVSIGCYTENISYCTN